MTLDSRHTPANESRIEIGSLEAGPSQTELIRTEPGVRTLLGVVSVKLFQQDARGLPVSSLFAIRSGDKADGGEDELLLGSHLFWNGDIVQTEHAVLVMEGDYSDMLEEVDAPQIEDIETATLDDLEDRMPPPYYVLESAFPANEPDVIIDVSEHVAALGQMIEADYQDGLKIAA